MSYFKLDKKKKLQKNYVRLKPVLPIAIQKDQPFNPQASNLADAKSTTSYFLGPTFLGLPK